MFIQRILMAAACGSLLTALPLQSAKITAKQIIAGMDKNKDGKISRAEASKQLKPHFDTTDTNGNGLIDVNEAQPMADFVNNQGTAATASARPVGRAEIEKIVASMDANRDGRISRKEASDDLILYFERYDRNRDGSIDRQEAQRLVDYAQSNHTMATPNKGKPAKAEKKNGRITAKQIVDGLDKNKDGKISKSEANADLRSHFANFDTNGDGFIDVKEADSIAQYANR